MCLGSHGISWPLLVAALVSIAGRRWWLTAAALALLTGAAVAGLHTHAIPEYRSGSSYELTVVLREMPRTTQGQWGASWRADAEVVAGGPSALVTVGGEGPPPGTTGARLTARVRATDATRPGAAASLWVRGEPIVVPASGWSADVRHRMRLVAGDGDRGWLLSGMALGLDQGLTSAAQTAMRDAGLTHITAVSGANCAVLLLLVDWACGWLRLRRWVRATVAGFVLAAFVTVVGSEPSVVRAATMAGLALIAAVVGGHRAAAHVLQVSVLLLLLIDPWLAFSVGFMLSVAATAGLVALIERGPLAATIAAQVATLPILLAIGASVGLRSVLANVLVTPLVAVIPVLGLGALIVAPLAAVGRALCGIVLAVAGWDSFPPLSWVPGAWGVALAAGLSLTVLLFGGRLLVPLAVSLVAVVSLTVKLADPWPPRDWWLVACDVGQGDGFVVRDGDHVVVVDTGPDPRLMDSCLDRLGVERIDLLVLTHFHADHVGGVRSVVSGRGVGQVWVSPCDQPQDSYAQALPALSGLHVAVPLPGTEVRVGGLAMRVVWPQRVIDAGSVPNNASVSFVLHGPAGSVAFLGDIEREAQRAILASSDIDTDIVKVPHHGSANFDPALPAAVSAQLALVGVGHDNTFGHPAPEAVAAWQATGARVLTTEDNGDIALTGDLSVVVRGRVEQ